jgi:hypothetical protein
MKEREYTFRLPILSHKRDRAAVGSGVTETIQNEVQLASRKTNDQGRPALKIFGDHVQGVAGDHRFCFTDGGNFAVVLEEAR